MPRLWDVPVHDSTRVGDARVAAERAAVLQVVAEGQWGGEGLDETTSRRAARPERAR